MMTRLTVSNHITMSDRPWVWTMWCGKWRASFRSAAIFQALVAARNFCPCGVLTCWVGASPSWKKLMHRFGSWVGYSLATLHWVSVSSASMVSTRLCCQVYSWSESPLQTCTSCRCHLLWSLSVISRAGKDVVGGVKKEGHGERFHNHQGRSWQFPGLSFLPVHPCALFGLASSNGHSLLLLDHVEFGDDHGTPAPDVLAGNHQCGVLPMSSGLGGSNELFDLESDVCCCTALSADHLVRVQAVFGIWLHWVPKHHVEPPSG